MDKADIAELAPRETPRNRQSISDPLDARDFSMNYYVLDPGETFAGRLHTHLDQEESFFILEGEATFETSTEPDGESETVTVREGQMVRFDPGEYQQGRNDSDERLRALAMGTPKESTEIRSAVQCPACGESEYMEFVRTDAGPALTCPECGAEVDL